MLWPPTRRQMMCGSPEVVSSPYSKVARPSGAHVISKIPGARLNVPHAQSGPKPSSSEIRDELGEAHDSSPILRLSQSNTAQGRFQCCLIYLISCDPHGQNDGHRGRAELL